MWLSAANTQMADLFGQQWWWWEARTEEREWKGRVWRSFFGTPSFMAPEGREDGRLLVEHQTAFGTAVSFPNQLGRLLRNLALCAALPSNDAVEPKTVELGVCQQLNKHNAECGSGWITVGSLLDHCWIIVGSLLVHLCQVEKFSIFAGRKIFDIGRPQKSRGATSEQGA